MAGVVIIHAQEDNAPAHALAAKIRALGLNALTEFASLDALRAAIEASDVTIALWSPRSGALPELIGEAAFARGLGVLVHARMHNMPAPRDFVGDPTIDLTGWKGEDNFSGWINLRAAIEGVMQAGAPSGFGARRGGTRPAPAPRAPESLYAVAAQAAPAPTRYEPDSYASEAPERDPYVRRETYAPRPYDAPPQPSENGGGMRLALIGLVTFAVIAGVGIGGYSLIQGGASSAEIEAAWNALDKTDPAALRAFLNEDGGGRFRRPAEIALEGLEVEAFRVAREADTIEALQAFLTAFPESRHSSRARGRLAELRQNQTAIDEPPPLVPADEPAPPTFGAAQPEVAAPSPDELDLPGGPVALTPGAPPAEDSAPLDEFANPTN